MGLRVQVAEVATALGVAIAVATAVVVGESVATGDPASQTVNESRGNGPTQSESEDRTAPPAGDPTEEPDPGAGAEVTDVTLTADPPEYTGPCPVTVTIAARIRTNTGPVTVRYRWRDGDGVSDGDETVQFGGPAPQGATVTDSVDVGDDSIVVRRLEVIAPNELASDPIEVAVACTPVAEVAAGEDEVLGTCSHRLHFDGRITVPHDMTVSYKWERSDGANAPTETVDFTGGGQQSAEVTTTWSLGVPGEFGQRLHLLEPFDVISDWATFTIEC